MAASSSVTESPTSPSAFFTRVLTWSLRRPPWLNPASNQLLSLPTRSTWKWSATTRPTRRWQLVWATTASPTWSTAWWSAPPAAPWASSSVPRQTGSWAATWKYSRCCEWWSCFEQFLEQCCLSNGGVFPTGLLSSTSVASQHMVINLSSRSGESSLWKRHLALPRCSKNSIRKMKMESLFVQWASGILQKTGCWCQWFLFLFLPTKNK